jgi:excinuclease ABC subunit A
MAENIFPITADEQLDELDARSFIIIKRARVNNLRNLSVAIPRNNLVVITGLSGSGKSSLAFNTLFAEGQRMYVESLSAYARQFLGRMEKPDVDYIRGVSPAIAIEQKVSTRNPRSTVGTTTELYDYLKILFARIGKIISPISNREVKRHTVSDVTDTIHKLPPGTRITITAPLNSFNGRKLEDELRILLSKGFSRILLNDQVCLIEEILEKEKLPKQLQVEAVIDRVVVNPGDEDQDFRLADSIQTAFYEGHDQCRIHVEGGETLDFSDRLEADGMTFTEPSVHFFSFNNPYGACRTCEGFGNILGIDEDLVIPDRSLSVYEGAVAPWRSEGMREWLKNFIRTSAAYGFPIHRPYDRLTEKQKDLLWKGNDKVEGLDHFFRYVESKLHKIQYRVLLSRYRGRTTCPDCRGTRIRKDAQYVKINHRSIIDLVLMSIDELAAFFRSLKLPEHEQRIAARILAEINSRLNYLLQVGLGYLTLNRLTSTLSGGEYQRIKLATSLGSSLVGSIYILDEPSIGLHPRDTRQLTHVLQSLRDQGNTVIVVEHEEEIIRAADQLIDIGPEAGTRGGQLVFQGTFDELVHAPHSLTARYLTGLDKIEVPSSRRKWKDAITITGAREHNLKNLTVHFPLGVLTAVTGVSGSGKSTLVKKILHPALARALALPSETPGKFDRLEGDIQRITRVEFVDQQPIGRSSRSNPVSYIKAYDPIRQLFAEQPLARQRGYTPAYFSFNVEGGRCETCQGEGEITVEMQFLADIRLTCESCGGKRFKPEILEVTYKDKSIADVLDMTVEESLDFFADKKSIYDKILPLAEAGMGYVRLGQSSNTLSGGEAQRVKLASFLGKHRDEEHILFIFDEPTTGLHFHDIRKLLNALQALVNNGHTVIVIEHNLEVIKCADWIIDLGPEGGDKGGHIVFAGTPEDMVEKARSSYTAAFLKEKLKT